MGKHLRLRAGNLCATQWATLTIYPTRAHGSTSKIWLLFALSASACASNPAGIQGRWVGKVTPVSGSCDSASQAVLNIEAGRTPPYIAIFTPTSGVLALHGNSDGVNEVAADLHTTGMNHQPYALAFSGTRNGNLINGTYITPRCRSTVQLERK